MKRQWVRNGRLRRAAKRGVTLVEVLIVVAIMSLIATGVSVAVIPLFNKAKIDTAGTNATELRNAVVRWRTVRSGSDCPTLSTLVSDKEVDKTTKLTDPWERPYKVECVEDETYVSSSGPDKKEGTTDDIVVPKKGPGGG